MNGDIVAKVTLAYFQVMDVIAMNHGKKNQINTSILSVFFDCYYFFIYIIFLTS